MSARSVSPSPFGDAIRASAARAALCVAALASCARPAPPTIASITPRAITVDAKGAAIGVDLGLHNPNGIDLPMQSVTAHVILNGSIDVGTIQVPTPVNLVAGKDTHVAVAIPIAWSSVGQLAPLAVAGQDATYKANGTVVLGGDFVNLTVPFEASGAITAQDILRGIMGQAAPPGR